MLQLGFLCVSALDQDAGRNQVNAVLLLYQESAMLICRFEPVARIITSPMDRSQTRPALYIADGPDAGTYSIADDVIRRVVNAWSNDISDAMFKKTYKKLNQCAPLRERTIDPDLVPVNNGIFNYKTKQFLPFSPDYVFLSKCRVNYNPDAAKVVIHNDDDNTDWDVDSWMDELSDDPEIVNLLWEVIGASIRPYVPWNKSAWFYATNGNNGKGTLCSLMRDLIGVESCAALSIKDFGDRFGLGGLVSATAVINDENDVDAINGNLGETAEKSV